MLLGAVIKSLFVFVLYAGVLAPFGAWLERRQGASTQDRVGGSRTAVAGLTFQGSFQPLADLLKALAKEDLPRTASGPGARALHQLAPAIALLPAVMGLAVLPFAGRYVFGGSEINLVAADLDAGIVYYLALSALAAWAPIASAWSAGDVSTRLGGIRAASQIVSCRVVLGLSLVPMLMIFESLRPSDMAVRQDALLGLGDALRSLGGPELPAAVAGLALPAWGVVLQPAAFLLFVTCALAEGRRPPFDLPEAGSELAGGSAAAHSGLRHWLLRASDRLQAVALAALVVTVFFGGWSLPFLPQEVFIGSVGPWTDEVVATALCLVLHVLSFLAKMAAVLWLAALVRWSVPRMRHDQLMDLCWKHLLPLSFLNAGLTAFLLVGVEAA